VLYCMLNIFPSTAGVLLPAESITMNENCYNVLITDDSISLFCKSWLWMYATVFSSERWRRWHGSVKYPFYSPDFMAEAFMPFQIQNDLTLRHDFYSYCEHWFDCCLDGNIFEMQKDLPHSDKGLGLISLRDINISELYDGLFGVLEFVDARLFKFLKDNSFPSLYTSNEGDLCVMFGPLSLCNNGRNLQPNYYPRFIDRDMLSDEELLYTAARKCFKNTILGVIMLPPVHFHYILFEHYALRIHVTNNFLIMRGDQIYVDYGHVTVT
jgi:hypothetical protein